MLGSFLLLYCILALYGTALLYIDVRRTGCDPSGAVDNDTCTSSGAGVFGAMLGTAKLLLVIKANNVAKSNNTVFFAVLCKRLQVLRFRHKVRANLVVSQKPLRKLVLRPSSRYKLSDVNRVLQKKQYTELMMTITMSLGQRLIRKSRMPLQ
jgi:hypothetical protein